jgi:hypothetical protein
MYTKALCRLPQVLRDPMCSLHVHMYFVFRCDVIGTLSGWDGLESLISQGWSWGSGIFGRKSFFDDEVNLLTGGSLGVSSGSYSYRHYRVWLSTHLRSI